MNLSFEHTMPMDGKSSCIASLALVNPSYLCLCEPHNRVEHRRAAKLHRSPEQNSKTLLQLSPIAIPLESGNILSVNIAKHRLLEWAKRSHIQSLVYITFCSDGQMHMEYWAYKGSCLSSLALSPYRLKEEQTLDVSEEMMIHIGDYQQTIDLAPLRKINQQLHDNLQKVAAATGSDMLSILDLATNGVGVMAWRYRRKVYSLPEGIEERIDILQDDKLMMRMGRVCSMGEDLDILYFMEDSAPIPHFHIVDKRTFGREFHTCIKIECLEYYHHTIEQYECFHHDGLEGALSAEQCQLLVDALNRVEHFAKLTNWQYLLHAWNVNNPQHKVDIHTPISNYSELIWMRE